MVFTGLSPRVLDPADEAGEGDQQAACQGRGTAYIVLRTHYAMSSTNVPYTATRSLYMSGTDIASGTDSA